MTYRDAKTISVRGQVQLRFARRAAKAIQTYQCLVVSGNPERAEMIERAAAEGGWRTVICTDAATALTHLSRSFVHLAVVDLEGAASRSFRPVLEQLTARGGLLLIVCGNEGNLEEEIWVRQLGAWLYLPGVAENSNLALLCGEARQIAERLTQATPERETRESPNDDTITHNTPTRGAKAARRDQRP